MWFTYRSRRSLFDPITNENDRSGLWPRSQRLQDGLIQCGAIIVITKDATLGMPYSLFALYFLKSSSILPIGEKKPLVRQKVESAGKIAH